MKAAEQFRIAEAFPIATFDERLGDGGLVVIAPHPDDESLACGGLLAEASASGRRACVIIVSDGTGSHPSSLSHPAEKLRNLRESEARQAVRELGLNPDRDLVFLRLPDRFVPSHGAQAEAAVETILCCIGEVSATSLFVTWRHDPHCDHQASFALARAAQRRAPSVSLYEYSVWGAALPDEKRVAPELSGFRLSIERRLAQKRRAIASHRSQVADLINDDPGGFRLQSEDLARFDSVYEIFFESLE